MRGVRKDGSVTPVGAHIYRGLCGRLRQDKLEGLEYSSTRRLIVVGSSRVGKIRGARGQEA